MGKFQKVSVFVLRIVLGILYFWAGITKVLDPTFSAAGYIQGAKLLPGFYHWLASPGILPITNFMNEWGLTLLGVSLLLGIGVRLSSSLGIVLMFLYYLPLGFPYPDAHSFVVDEHIILIGSLLVLIAFNAGKFWGLMSTCSELPVCSRYPKLRDWIG